ncbi:MAG: helix-turn-helix transcriptional regulator [Bacteroidota bacterium]|nr:helix-turn-helix transcriptional regulator [Bacteroidota bacterium]
MKDRILKFLNEKDFSSTKLADLINVQRSSISHILSGRNKPSFDFTQKLLNKFPEINAQWLITGKGNMFVDKPETLQTPHSNNENPNLFSGLESNIQNDDDKSPVINKPQEQKNEIPKSKIKSIERVMIFYSDGTFKDYRSSD